VSQEQESSMPVTVYILDKEYRVACREGEEDVLRSSAQYLDRRMREIRQTGRIVGAERIAVMAALNITHELLEQRQVQDRSEQAFGQRIRSLQKKIELALGSDPSA
jgi:cell division protein ZapA